jgi:hypothetical protein
MKKFIETKGRQQGVVTIFVSMILLLLITLLVVTAYSLSIMNLQAVGNVQVREEGLAAANVMIDRTIDSEFWTAPASVDNEVDLNGDGAADFLVAIALPRCVRASLAEGNVSSSVTLPGMSSSGAWNTIWELDATATEANTGTRVRVLQGIRVMLSAALKDTYCPTT